MDIQRKTIQKLTESLDEKRSELTNLYSRFGEKLLKESTESAEVLVAVSSEKVESWRNLMAVRKEDTQAILEIKDVLARKQELVHFSTEIERNCTTIDSDYHAVLEKIGRACYEHFTDTNSIDFAQTAEKAAVEGAILVKLEKKREKLADELNSAGALARILVQFKITGNNSAIKQHRGRMMTILTDGARLLVEDGSLNKRMEAGELDEQFEQIMDALRETTDKRRDLDKRKETLEAEKKALQETLGNYSATENPQRRIDEIYNKIKDTDRRLVTVSIMTARDYCDTYINEEGVMIESTNPIISEKSQPLEQVAALRAGIVDTRKNIEVLEATLKIEALDKNLASIERSRAEFERKINQYREQIDTLEAARLEAISERTDLHKHRDSIQNSIS